MLNKTEKGEVNNSFGMGDEIVINSLQPGAIIH